MHTDIGVYRVKSFFTTLYINLQHNFFYSENLTTMLMTMIMQSNFFVSFVACSNQPNGTSSYKARQHSASYINGQTGDPKDEIKDNGRSSDFYLKPAALYG